MARIWTTNAYLCIDDRAGIQPTKETHWIPACAGMTANLINELDSRLRGNDG
jgi:hypothetical protein